jgi:circadian clock protein KaiB
VIRTSRLRLRLYIAGDTENSAQARANLTAICDHLLAQPEIEIVDVLKEPKRALADGIFMTPTLVKLRPAPAQKLVGTLSHTESVLQALGMKQERVAA